MPYRYHPELQEIADGPESPLAMENFVGSVDEMREFAAPLYVEMRALPMAADVTATDFEIETSDGFAMRARWYRKEGFEARSAVVYAHGGGMILMGIDEMDADLSRYVSLCGVPFLSVAYRLAPENPRPLAEDVLESYRWLRARADEFGIDENRIALMGDSGGAGVVAGAAILARDRGVPLAKQILIYPMLDDRTVTCDPEIDPFLFTWCAGNNETAWGAVLGDRRGTDEVLPSEAPARNENFEGLADAFVEVGGLDLFRDEAMAYARRLMDAGVPTELHVISGVPHCYDTLPVTVAEKAFQYRSYVISQL